jgi:hypothetical protein
LRAKIRKYAAANTRAATVSAQTRRQHGSDLLLWHFRH